MTSFQNPFHCGCSAMGVKFLLPLTSISSLHAGDFHWSWGFGCKRDFSFCQAQHFARLLCPASILRNGRDGFVSSFSGWARARLLFVRRRGFLGPTHTFYVAAPSPFLYFIQLLVQRRESVVAILFLRVLGAGSLCFIFGLTVRRLLAAI